jgi:hypothetical protein
MFFWCSPDYCQHEPFTFIPPTQHKHGNGNNKRIRQTMDRMKTKGEEEELGELQPSWFLPTFTFLPLFLQQHEGDGGGKIYRQKQKHINKGKRRRPLLIVVKLHVMDVHFVCVVAQ